MKLKIFKYKVVKSTNDTAINLIKKKQYENGIVYALSQKKGRGRFGKKWISYKGNFFASIFFHLKANYPTIKEFNLINPLLNIDVIKNYFGIKKTYFKPPNDIYIKKRKVCGILQEVIFSKEKKYLIVGIGINLVSNPIIKNYPSTNIYKEINKKPNLFKLIKQIIFKYENFFLNIQNYNFLDFKTKSKKLLIS